MISTTTAGPPGPQTWLSGDWTKQPNSKPPYNGIKIVATPVYDPQSHDLTELTLVISDFTKSKAGADLPEAFKTIREKAKVELPKPAGDVTIAGSLELLMTGAPGRVLLFVDLAWGLDHLRHHANGGILEVPLTDAGAATAPATDGAATDEAAPDAPSPDGSPDAAGSKGRQPSEDRPASKGRRPRKGRPGGPKGSPATEDSDAKS